MTKRQTLALLGQAGTRKPEYINLYFTQSWIHSALSKSKCTWLIFYLLSWIDRSYHDSWFYLCMLDIRILDRWTAIQGGEKSWYSQLICVWHDFMSFHAYEKRYSSILKALSQAPVNTILFIQIFFLLYDLEILTAQTWFRNHMISWFRFSIILIQGTNNTKNMLMQSHHGQK